ncbi:uncharacterized protein LOC114294749 [Camellia sinensis]|uniref:uncharacterized protein LOC114294749 n=1 Tax=Camellia sinensis TaxID=4442 RepID=UPI001035E322|nr:uncharacterized protein LOC114294749 [Camellia sinensis]
MKLLSWNIRGLGRPEKKKRIKAVIKERKVDMVMLQETKRANISNQCVKSIWPYDQVAYMNVDADGSAGGLLCVWKPEVFSLADCCCNRSFIILSSTLFNSLNCVIVNVYALNDVSARRSLWVSLINLKVVFPKPWCIGGDFNEIKSIDERKVCIRRDKGMVDFCNFISCLELMDFPMLERKFTWCNSLEGERWSRLDRFLVGPEWLVWFRFKLWGLHRFISNHCPIILIEDDRNWGPKPFRFINAGASHPSFLNQVKKVWEGTQVDGWVGYKLKIKLQALKQSLRQWNSEVFGNMDSKLKQAEENLHAIDLIVESRDLDEVEGKRRREVWGEVWKLRKIMERIWLQKSRLNWNLKGDKNTKFFHIIATNKQNTNAIDSMSVNGELVKELLEVKEAVYDHFRGRNILDGVLIANEMVDWWKKSRGKGLILKLDFQKAYDTVN